MEILDIKESLRSEEILPILAESVYMPTVEKLNARAESYMNNSKVTVLGASKDDKFCGIIVMENREGKELYILDIAVLKGNQKQGIGHAMITYVQEIYRPSCIIAETDDDAVNFYRKIGFKVKGLGEKYPGITRYECKYFKCSKE